jgi:hypothetical protein
MTDKLNKNALHRVANLARDIEIHAIALEKPQIHLTVVDNERDLEEELQMINRIGNRIATLSAGFLEELADEDDQ